MSMPRSVGLVACPWITCSYNGLETCTYIIDPTSYFIILKNK